MSDIIIPDYLSIDFKVHVRKIVHINLLNVGIQLLHSDEKKYTCIYDTPHYMHACHIINDDPLKVSHGYKNYDHYASLNVNVCTEEEFTGLINSINENRYDWEKRPILVFRHWKRPLPIGRWDVADGFHRLAVLAALGERRIKVVTLRPKKNLFQRFSEHYRKKRL